MSALAAGLALASLVPLGQLAHAEEADAPEGVVTDSPVGMLVFGPTDDDVPPTDGTDTTPPPSTEPEPSPQPEPEPQPQPAPTGSTSGPLAAPSQTSPPRPPQRSVSLAAPAATGSRSGADAPRATRAGGSVSLEAIFGARQPMFAPASGAVPVGAARSAVGTPQSSLPTLLITALMGLLGGLLLASRQFGPALFSVQGLRNVSFRRSAPRGWRVVPTEPFAPAITVRHAPSALERPVLSAPQASSVTSR